MSGVSRSLRLPAGALHGLRAAALAAPDGARRLRDAGDVAGLALFDDFAAHVRETTGAEPEALSIEAFTRELAAHLAARGWGTVEIEPSDDALRVTSADWVEGEPDAGASRPACHFSEGVLCGFFMRAAGEPIAVTQAACRSSGDAACVFVVGGRGA